MAKPKDISLGNQSAATGRYNFVISETDGDVSFDDTEAHAVMTSVIEHRGTNPFDTTHGSDLHTLRNMTSRTPSQATAMALDGLQSLEADNTVVAGSTVTAKAKRVDGVNRLDLDVTWTTPAGKRGREKLPGV